MLEVRTPHIIVCDCITIVIIDVRALKLKQVTSRSHSFDVAAYPPDIIDTTLGRQYNIMLYQRHTL